MPEFKYLGCVLNESGADEAECRIKVANERGLQVPLGIWLIIGVCRLSV